jgi:hypothetical protein
MGGGVDLRFERGDYGRGCASTILKERDENHSMFHLLGS